jgi:hypothetical protein
MDPKEIQPERKEIAGGLTQSEIDALKREHGKLTLVSIEGEGHWWFKKPNMQTLSASAAMAERDPMGSAMVYFTNCLVKGDAKAAEDVDIWISIAPHLNNLIESKTAEVKNF